MDLYSHFNTYQDLESAPVSSVAGVILKALLPTLQNGEKSFSIYNCTLATRNNYGGRWECARAVAEAFGWLEARTLICTAPEQSGWSILTRAGLAAAKTENFESWARDSELPTSLLHPLIIQECMLNFRIGKYDTAVFEAFKILEVAVRTAASLLPSDIGVALSRKAFRPTDGILTNRLAEAGEQQALADLMAGAIGSYKNPHSHRKQALDPVEAREMLILASHLLKIVETRGLAPN